MTKTTFVGIFCFIVGFLLGLAAESSAWATKDYVINYKEAEKEIKQCEALLPRNINCKVFYTFETRADQ